MSRAHGARPQTRREAASLPTCLLLVCPIEVTVPRLGRSEESHQQHLLPAEQAPLDDCAPGAEVGTPVAEGTRKQQEGPELRLEAWFQSAQP